MPFIGGRHALISHLVTWFAAWVAGSHVIIESDDGVTTSLRCVKACFEDVDYTRHITNTTRAIKFAGHTIGELTHRTLFGGRLLTGLLSLDLTNNGITEIRAESFALLPNLVSLSLGMNKWLTPSTSSQVFAGLESLRFLDLSSVVAGDFRAQQWNDSDALEQLLGNTSAWFPVLEVLHLEDNGLTFFPLEAIMSSMPSLLELWLSNNNLDTVEFREPVMHQVRLIHIDDNNITWLSRESIANLILMNTTRSLELVNISNNPLECDCRNRWLVHWVHWSLDADMGSSRLLVDVERLICHQPPRLLGRFMHTVKFVDIDSQLCRPRAAMYGVPHIVGGLIVGLVVFAFVVRVLMNDRKLIRRKMKDGTDLGSTLPSTYWQFVS